MPESPEEASPRTSRRVLLGAGAGVVVAGAAAGGYLLTRRSTGAEEADAVIAALGSGDFSGVRITGMSAEEAAAERERAIGPLLETEGSSVEVTGELGEDEGERRPLTLEWAWTLPGLEEPWRTSGESSLVRDDEGWAAELTPTAFAPELTPTRHLELESLPPQMARILDREGNDIYGPREVLVVGLDKSAIPESEQGGAARDLAEHLGIDAEAYASSVEGNGEKAFVPALTVRAEQAEDYDLEEAAGIPGYLQVEQTQPLAIGRGYAPGVLGSLREASAEDLEKDPQLRRGDLVASGGIAAARRAQLLGTPGTVVLAAEDDSDAPADRTELHRSDPIPGTDVTTTLLHELQVAATQRLAEAETPSAVIALQPSTGDLLAAALGPDGQSYPIGLVGNYAPGSTFKTVTALALLREGDTPETELQCTERLTVNGRSFKNADSLDAGLFGPMPLSEVIAQSCNTALLAQHEKVSQSVLAQAAGSLGIGQEAPEGLDAFLGSIDPGDEGTEHAAAMIGQGRVLTSPLAMAVVLASVVDGRTVAPRVLADAEATAPEPEVPLATEEADQLRSMLAGVVDHGSLDDLAGIPGPAAIGKSGTAEWTSEDGELLLHSWVIVAQGDLAVAVFVEEGSYGSVTAGPIGRDILEAARSIS